MNKIIDRLKTLPRLFAILVTIIAALGVGTSGFLYVQYQKAQNTLNNPSVVAQLESQDLVKKVSRFISLPEGELPTIATVSDYKKLKDQPFFEKSQNGDKVLIYTKAKKAYLYRPSTDKLIDVTIVNVDSSAAQQSPVASASPKSAEIKIVLRNGTSTVGLTNKLEPEIKKVLPNSTIVKKENAAKSDYQTTVVVVLNENASQAASVVADYLKATVTSLPSDESKPNDIDILVIIGKDKAPSPYPVGP